MSETPSPALTPDQEMEAAFKSGIEDSLPEIQVEALPAEVPPTEDKPAVVPPPAAAPSTPSEWKPREFTFKHNGKEVTFTPSSAEEEVTFFSKGYDYTQKTQALSEERKQLQGIAKELLNREKERQGQIQAFLSNKEAVREYYLKLHGEEPVAPASPVDEDTELVFKSEFAKMREQLLEEVRAESAKSAQAQNEKVEIARLQSDFSADFNQTLDSLIKTQFPILQHVEGVERLIREDGHKAFKAQEVLDPYHPVDPSVVKAAMVESATRRASKLNASLRVHEKVVAAQKETLTTRGAEGAGGNAPPAPAEKKYKLSDKELDARVVAEIQSLMK